MDIVIQHMGTTLTTRGAAGKETQMKSTRSIMFRILTRLYLGLLIGWGALHLAGKNPLMLGISLLCGMTSLIFIDSN